MKNIFIIAFIFLSAVFLRISFLDLIEFKYDEAFTVFELNQFFSHPYLMQVGPPQSTGVYNPPLFNYFMIAISLFSRHPQYLSLLIALINSIFIVIFYHFVKKFYNPSFAVFSSLLLAFSPWSIIFSRKIWVPDLIQPLIIIFLYFFYLIYKENRKGVVIPMFSILALLPQLHASGLFFLISTMIILKISKIKVDLKKAVLGFGLGVIPAIPYFFRQLTSSPFCIDCQAFLNYQKTSRSFDLENFIRPFHLLGGLNFQVLLGEDFYLFWDLLPGNNFIYALFVVQILLLFLGIVFIIFYQKKELFLIYYLIFLPLFYFLTKTPSYMHYFMVINPIVILLTAFGLTYLKKINQTFIFQRVIWLFFVLIIGGNIFFQLQLYNFISTKENISGDFGPIFPLTEKFVNEKINNYLLFSDYEQLRSYAFMFAQSPYFHFKIAEYFIKTNKPLLAIDEFKKDLSLNEENIYSRVNLVYLYSQLDEIEQAKIELSQLELQDSTLAAKIKKELFKKE